MLVDVHVTSVLDRLGQVAGNRNPEKRSHINPWPKTSFKTRIATGAGTRRSMASCLSIRTIPNVETPLWEALAAIPDAATKTVADLGCGTGPLLPYLAERFERVIALDFAPGMLKLAAARLSPEAAARVTFLERPMHELDDLAGQLDVAVAVNSLVMPDVRLIDRTLRSIRASLKPGGQFLGVVPSIDTICYHLMLLMDQVARSGSRAQGSEEARGPSHRAPSLRFRVRGVSLRGPAAKVLAAVRDRISPEQGRILVHDPG